MKTGMIIIHYNDIESVTNLIHNVENYKVLDRIIIYDNNSEKNIKKKLKKLESDKVKVIENYENKGYSYAINEASKELIKELKECNIIVSNADVIIGKEEDIKGLIKELDKIYVGAVAPTIVENNTLNRGWREPNPIMDSLLNLIYIHRFFRKKYIFYKEEYYKDKTSEVDVISGCFFLIKSKTLESINYLDENLFLYYEENVLAKKLKIKRKKLVVCNDILIIHNHSVSIDKNMNKLKKLKEQKKSQYYFHTEYNDANKLEKGLLKLTSFTSRIALTVFYFLKDLKK